MNNQDKVIEEAKQVVKNALLGLYMTTDLDRRTITVVGEIILKDLSAKLTNE